MIQQLGNLTGIHEDTGPIPGSVSYGSDVTVSCGVGHRGDLDPEFLWLWCRLVAIVLIRPLAWEPPYAMCVALEKTKRTPPPKKKDSD